MFKTIRDMVVGAFAVAAIGSAWAVVGQVPVPGFQAVDGTWLLGVVGGQNWTYQYGVVAHAGGTQAACQSLAPNFYLIEIDTVATTGDSVCLPYAQAGNNFSVRNAGAQTLDIYGQAANNALTGAADTINGTAGSTAYTVVSQNSVECFAAKNGSWSCVQGH